MPSTELSWEDEARAYEEAIKNGNDEYALVDLAVLLLTDKDDEPAPDRSRGIQLLERAIKQFASQGALVELSYQYRFSDSRSDRHRAIPLLEQAVQQEPNMVSLVGLAKALADPELPMYDLERAVQIFKRCSRNGRASLVMADLAELQLRQPSLQVDRRSALRLFKDAIKVSNSPSLMTKLGHLYSTGTALLPRSYDDMIKWYQRAIDDGKYSPAKYYLACALTSTEWDQPRNPFRAAQLFEEALDQNPCEGYALALADLYVDYLELQKTERGILLYEATAKKYNSRKARCALIYILAHGLFDIPIDCKRVLTILKPYRSSSARCRLITETVASVLWSGAIGIKPRRKFAVDIARTTRWPNDYTLSLMLRYGAPGLPVNRHAAKKRYRQVKNKAAYDIAHSLFISEPSDPEYDPGRAIRIIPSIVTLDSEYVTAFGWLPLYLRMSKIRFPYHGHEQCFTYSVKRFAGLHDILILNMASLLLEEPSSSETSNTIICMFEDLMGTELHDVATLNLSYVLWKGVGVVSQDKARAIGLLEGLVEERNDISARVLLTSILAEETNENNIQRCLSLWRTVEEETDEDEELKKLSRLLSAKANTVLGFHQETGL